MKKLLAIFLAVALSFSVTACSSTKEVATGEKEKIELNYWFAYGGPTEEANKGLVEKFNNSQDAIHVTATNQGSYSDVNSKVQASIAAGNSPDIFVGQNIMMETFAKEGMIESLTPFVKADSEEVKIEDFIPGLLGNSYVDDQMYGLPYLVSTPLLYVNKTMLDKAGIDVSQLETWEGFSQAARKLSKDGVKAVSMESDIWIYEAFIAQAGGSMVNKDGTQYTFNEKPGVEALDFMRDLVIDGAWKVPVGDNASDVAFQDFASQKSVFRFASTANLTQMIQAAEENGFELTALMLPKNVKQAVNTGGSNIVMMAGLDEEKKQAAWEFIKFMTGTEQNLYASKVTGYLPTRYSSIESDERQKLHAEQPMYKVAVDQLKYAEPRPMIPGYNEIEKKVYPQEVERLIIDHSIDTKQGLDRAVDRSNALLKNK
ncbi:ABC transporter substrate-binding protein [Bacillus sp. FJAT-49705]|uniref:ABC transporter substrate-binding protein n=1 Tax=Cytobacillus citreus TaxID=2833586 RepID=A0ABS5NUN6_9BACI|nr:ABC transporter substrate-binding protein [Cytobacillus citreus]MBS4190609.1 ABC transporter substrate-binding protein [Cytobacillus citreus]